MSVLKQEGSSGYLYSINEMVVDRADGSVETKEFGSVEACKAPFEYA